MTVEESHSTFSCHAAFIAQLQRIPMHPFVINIDRNRTERVAGEKQERSTRDWINTLRLENGNPMQCDVENGGPDKRAYILVPTQFLGQAKAALEQYRIQLRQGGGANASNYRYTNPDGLHEDRNTHTRPTEIYVPTVAVLKNLQRMKNLSSTEIWQSAPSTIRTSLRSQQHFSTHTNAAPNQNHPPTQQNNQSNKYAQRSQNITPEEEDVTHTRPTPIKKNTGMADNYQKYSTDEFPPMQSHVRRPSLDTTVGTTQTRTTITQTANFAELEAAFKRHQSDFNTITTTVNTMDARVTTTMAACTTTAQQIIHIENRLDQMVIALQSIADNMAPSVSGSKIQKPQRSAPPSVHQPNAQETHTSEDEDEFSLDRTPGGSSNASMNTANTKSTVSSRNQSPEKKKARPTEEPNMQNQQSQSIISNLSDQQGSQYNSNSPSDGRNDK